jgi:hypothetical protein
VDACCSPGCSGNGGPSCDTCEAQTGIVRF